MSNATTMLAAYIAAETAVLSGKSYRMLDGRELRMENLDLIQAGRKEWEARVSAEAARAAGASTTLYRSARFDQ